MGKLMPMRRLSLRELALVSVFAAAWVWVVTPGCALPTLEEAGKDRCNTKDDCLGGLRCVEGYCSKSGVKPRATNPCPEKECPKDYACHWGVCADIFPQQDPSCDVAYEQAGCTDPETEPCCPSDAICLDVGGGETLCYAYAECDRLGDCPRNRPRGVVCSDLAAPGKDMMCLPGRCENEEHCPQTEPPSSAWACVGAVPGTTLGECDNAGSQCLANEDCTSGVCNTTDEICE